jgi:two-component system chemotaxis family response regulator WspR
MSTESTEIEEKGPENRDIILLLVDDQEIIAEGIKKMLEKEPDINFHYCQDPSKAIEIAAEIDATIILQDLVMPDVDGMTLVRFFRANEPTKDIPIIVLSSKEDPVIKSDAFTNGANDYLVKLPDKIELIARIRSHAKHYQMKKERDSAFFALRELQKQLEASNAELLRLSSMDGLTGLANRRRFDEKLLEEIKRGSREKTELSLIMIDIDFFKPFNDTYGHQGGDDCLKKVANALGKIACRNSDLAARYGGEEFAIVLPLTNESGSLSIGERLRAGIENLKIPHEASQVESTVTISLGCATLIPDKDTTPEMLIEMADKALYNAKDSGRNKLVAMAK